jgi:hypothetical protein
MDEKPKFILLKITKALLLLSLIVFAIFSFCFIPILGESKDFIVIYCCIGAIGLFGVIFPKLSQETMFFSSSNKKMTKNDLFWGRLTRLMLTIISIFKLKTYL